MASGNCLKKDIQDSLAELTADREIFEKAEFNTAGIQKMFEKYGEQPTSIFDFWYDKHKKLEQRVTSLENQNEIFLNFFRNYMKECVNASSEAAQKILEMIKKYPEIKLNQIRTNFPFANAIVKMMLVFKRTNEDMITEQELEKFTLIESEILEIEESFVHSYTFDFPEKKSFNNSIKIEFHWLLSDERLNTTALQNDYPILVRF
jgi:hypothetical protein